MDILGRRTQLEVLLSVLLLVALLALLACLLVLGLGFSSGNTSFYSFPTSFNPSQSFLSFLCNLLYDLLSFCFLIISFSSCLLCVSFPSFHTLSLLLWLPFFVLSFFFSFPSPRPFLFLHAHTHPMSFFPHHFLPSSLYPSPPRPSFYSLGSPHLLCFLLFFLTFSQQIFNCNTSNNFLLLSSAPVTRFSHDALQTVGGASACRRRVSRWRVRWWRPWTAAPIPAATSTSLPAEDG